MRMPEPRPLYNLPAISAVDAVVLVEGEKCADALMRVGIVATTAMGGAATAIDKTDWSPLTGKTIAVWPDHDAAGAKYADAVITKLRSIGAQVRRVTVPMDKPKKWDAADADAIRGFVARVAARFGGVDHCIAKEFKALVRGHRTLKGTAWMHEGQIKQALVTQGDVEPTSKDPSRLGHGSDQLSQPRAWRRRSRPHHERS